MQNVEQRRRNDLLIKQQQRSFENSLIKTPTTSRLLRNAQNQYGSDTNIFRDHLNVPLTPTTTRQRIKVNKTSRERFCASSRDISYTNDEQEEQMESLITTTRTQNLLPNAVPRKRGHSPTAKSVFTKRPFNALPICAITQDQQSDDVFISPILDDDAKMDCSTTTTEEEEINSNMNDDHLLPANDSSSTRVISVCEIQPSFYLTTPIRRLFDPSNDQSTPNQSSSSLNDFQHLNYSDTEDENNKENSHYPTPITTSSSSSNENSNSTEVKKSSIYKLILRNPLYK